MSLGSAVTREELGSRAGVKPVSSVDGGGVSEAEWGGNRRERSKGSGGHLGWNLLRKRGSGAFRLVCSGRSWAQEEVGQVL